MRKKRSRHISRLDDLINNSRKLMQRLLHPMLKQKSQHHMENSTVAAELMIRFEEDFVD